jgi:lactoylglutathione lyase
LELGAFYEKLGFSTFGGTQEQNWLIMGSGTTLVGLFQGMFEKSMLTFNPGWDGDAKTLSSFIDVRQIQVILKARGLTLDLEVGDSPSGPAYLSATDPNGNPILIDQHV